MLLDYSLMCKLYNQLECLQHVQQVPQKTAEELAELTELTAEELAELIAARLFSNVQII